MTNILLCYIVASILTLFAFIFYSFLSKVPQKGKTKIKWKVMLYKILQIEFEAEHGSNNKNN